MACGKVSIHIGLPASFQSTSSMFLNACSNMCFLCLPFLPVMWPRWLLVVLAIHHRQGSIPENLFDTTRLAVGPIRRIPPILATASQVWNFSESSVYKIMQGMQPMDRHTGDGLRLNGCPTTIDFGTSSALRWNDTKKSGVSIFEQVTPRHRALFLGWRGVVPMLAQYIGGKRVWAGLCAELGACVPVWNGGPSQTLIRLRSAQPPGSKT